MAEVGAEVVKPKSKAEGLKTSYEHAGFMKDRLLQHRQDIEELRKTRERARLTAAEQIGEHDAEAHWLTLDSETLAHRRLGEFSQKREEYLAWRQENLGAKDNPDQPSKLKAITNVAGNFTRMIGDGLMFWRSRRVDEERLKEKQVRLKVLGREGLLSDSDFLELVTDEKNKPIIKQLLDREVFKEVNCTHLLQVSGINTEELHYLMEKMGQNPRAFLSDNRGENGGRLAIDNEAWMRPEQGQISVTEEKLWEKVFPKTAKWLPWSKWSMSRTHGVIYQLKNETGDDVMLIPVHVDPKNAVAVFGDRKAMSYHQTAAGKDKNYVGTGLYDLGSRVLINLFKKAETDKFVGRVVTVGEDSLRTRGTITGDEAITQKINGLVKQRQSRVK